MRLSSSAQLRVSPADVDPEPASAPQLLAPLARAIHHGHCPICGASVHGLELSTERGGTQVQITCFGDPAHVFFFDSSTGRVPDQPTSYGRIRND